MSQSIASGPGFCGSKLEESEGPSSDRPSQWSGQRLPHPPPAATPPGWRLAFWAASICRHQDHSAGRRWKAGGYFSPRREVSKRRAGLGLLSSRGTSRALLAHTLTVLHLNSKLLQQQVMPPVKTGFSPLHPAIYGL